MFFAKFGPKMLHCLPTVIPECLKMTFGFSPSYWDEYTAFLQKKKIFLGYKVPTLTSPTPYSIAVFLQPCDPCLISTSGKVLQAGNWGLWGIKATCHRCVHGSDCSANAGRQNLHVQCSHRQQLCLSSCWLMLQPLWESGQPTYSIEFRCMRSR